MYWPRAIRFRYSLRALLVFVTLFALWSGYHANRGWKERRAERTLAARGHASFRYGRAHDARNPAQAIAAAYERVVMTVGLERYITFAEIVTPLAPQDVSALRSLPHLRSLSATARWPSAGVPRVHTSLHTGFGGQVLERVSLKGYVLSDDNCSALAGQHSIKELAIHDSSLSLRGVSSILTMSRLHSLSLSRCDVTEADVHSYQSSPSIEVIGIGNTPLSVSAASVIAGCPRLRVLLASRSIDWRFLKALHDHPSLTELSVLDAEISDSWINEIKQMRSLRTLIVSSDRISPHDIASLQESRNDIKVVMPQ